MLARRLGWFSLALGAAEMLAPRRLNRVLGVRPNRDWLVRGFGARESAAGIGIPGTRCVRPTRVAGALQRAPTR